MELLYNATTPFFVVMLELFGKNDRQPSHCDGYSRRDFLKVGGMAAGGLSLGQLLGMEAKAGTGSSHKAVINIYLPGGPSHLDMFDLKPDAPSEIRGCLLYTSPSPRD